MPAHIHAVRRDGAGEPAPAAPDRVLAGSGASKVWNAFSDPSGRFHVGHWSCEDGARAVTYDETELCLILEGRVRLEAADGAAEFGPGDAFVITRGFVGVWRSIGPVSKLYAILDPEAPTPGA
jgi:uncharacterized cupin superfamily protein